MTQTGPEREKREQAPISVQFISLKACLINEEVIIVTFVPGCDDRGFALTDGEPQACHSSSRSLRLLDVSLLSAFLSIPSPIPDNGLTVDGGSLGI